jgi:hypothetical protein
LTLPSGLLACCAVAVVFCLAPGPNTVLVVNRALGYGRRTALVTALGSVVANPKTAAGPRNGPANLLDAVRTVASPGYLLRHDSPRPSRRLQRPRLLTVSGPSRLEAETPLLDRFSQPRRPSRTRRRKMRPIRSLLQST